MTNAKFLPVQELDQTVLQFVTDMVHVPLSTIVNASRVIAMDISRALHVLNAYQIIVPIQTVRLRHAMLKAHVQATEFAMV